MKEKVAKGKAKAPRKFGLIKGLVPIKESAIQSKKLKPIKSSAPRLDAVDGQIAHIDGNLSRCSSVNSGLSYETTTTNSEFYRESRLSVSEEIKDESWINRLLVDQSQSGIKNVVHNNISAVALENLSSNLPKTGANRVYSSNTANSDKNNNLKEAVTAKGSVNYNNYDSSYSSTSSSSRTVRDEIKMAETVRPVNANEGVGTIHMTPELNGIPNGNSYSKFSSIYSRDRDEIITTAASTPATPVPIPEDNNNNPEHFEVISKTIPVIDESFTSLSTTIEGNARSTIKKTTSKKVTVTEVSKRKENRIKV